MVGQGRHERCALMTRISEQLPNAIVRHFLYVMNPLTKKCPCELSKSADFPCNKKQIYVRRHMKDIKGKVSYNNILEELTNPIWAYSYARLSREMGITKQCLASWRNSVSAPTKKSYGKLLDLLKKVRLARFDALRRPLDPVCRQTDRMIQERSMPGRKKIKDLKSEIW